MHRHFFVCLFGSWRQSFLAIVVPTKSHLAPEHGWQSRAPYRTSYLETLSRSSLCAEPPSTPPPFPPSFPVFCHPASPHSLISFPPPLPPYRVLFTGGSRLLGVRCRVSHSGQSRAVSTLLVEMHNPGGAQPSDPVYTKKIRSFCARQRRRPHSQEGPGHEYFVFSAPISCVDAFLDGRMTGAALLRYGALKVGHTNNIARRQKQYGKCDREGRRLVWIGSYPVQRRYFCERLFHLRLLQRGGRRYIHKCRCKVSHQEFFTMPSIGGLGQARVAMEKVLKQAGEWASWELFPASSVTEAIYDLILAGQQTADPGAEVGVRQNSAIFCRAMDKEHDLSPLCPTAKAMLGVGVVHAAIRVRFFQGGGFRGVLPSEPCDYRCSTPNTTSQFSKMDFSFAGLRMRASALVEAVQQASEDLDWTKEGQIAAREFPLFESKVRKMELTGGIASSEVRAAGAKCPSLSRVGSNTRRRDNLRARALPDYGAVKNTTLVGSADPLPRRPDFSEILNPRAINQHPQRHGGKVGLLSAYVRHDTHPRTTPRQRESRPRMTPIALLRTWVTIPRQAQETYLAARDKMDDDPIANKRYHAEPHAYRPLAPKRPPHKFRSGPGSSREAPQRRDQADELVFPKQHPAVKGEPVHTRVKKRCTVPKMPARRQTEISSSALPASGAFHQSAERHGDDLERCNSASPDLESPFHPRQPPVTKQDVTPATQVKREDAEELETPTRVNRAIAESLDNALKLLIRLPNKTEQQRQARQLVFGIIDRLAQPGVAGAKRSLDTDEVGSDQEQSAKRRKQFATTSHSLRQYTDLFRSLATYVGNDQKGDPWVAFLIVTVTALFAMALPQRLFTTSLEVEGSAWIHPLFDLKNGSPFLDLGPLVKALGFLKNPEHQYTLATRLAQHHGQWVQDNPLEHAALANLLREGYGRLPQTKKSKRIPYHLLPLMLIDLLISVHDDETQLTSRRRHAARPHGSNEPRQQMETYATSWYEELIKASKNVAAYFKAREEQASQPPAKKPKLDPKEVFLDNLKDANLDLAKTTLHGEASVRAVAAAMSCVLNLKLEEIQDAVPVPALDSFIGPLLWAISTGATAATKNLLARRSIHPLYCVKSWGAMGTEHRVDRAAAFCSVERTLWKLLTRTALSEISAQDCLRAFFAEEDVAKLVQAKNPALLNSRSLAFASDAEVRVDAPGTLVLNEADSADEREAEEREQRLIAEEQQALQQAEQERERIQKEKEAEDEREQLHQEEERLRQEKEAEDERERLSKEEERIAKRTAELESKKQIAEERKRQKEERAQTQQVDKAAKQKEQQELEKEVERQFKKQQKQKLKAQQIEKAEAKRREKEEQDELDRNDQAGIFPALVFKRYTHNFTEDVTSFAVYNDLTPSLKDEPGELLKRHQAKNERLSDEAPVFGDGITLPLYSPNDSGELGQAYLFKWQPVADPYGNDRTEDGTEDAELRQIEDMWQGRRVRVVDGVEWPLHMLPSARDEEVKGDGSQSEVFVISFSDWIKKDAQFIGRILKERSILIYDVPAPWRGLLTFSESVHKIGIRGTLTEYQDGSLNKEFELPSDRMRVGLVDAMVPDPTFRGGRPLLNALYHPMGNHIMPDIPHWSSITTHAEALKVTAHTPGLPKVSLPYDHLQWGILGNAGVKTDPHSDSLGYTLIQPDNEECDKLWIVLPARDDGLWCSRHLYAQQTWRESSAEGAQTHEAEFLLLRNDTILIMRPLLLHAVYTHHDSAMTGKHGHNRHCIARSVAAEIHTVMAGEISTNIDHSEVDSLLVGRQDEHIFDLTDADDAFQFFFVLAYCVLWPALNKSEYANLQRIKLYHGVLPMYIGRFQEYAYLCKRIGIFQQHVEAEDACEFPPDGFPNLQAAMEHAIIQMACCCLRYRRNIAQLDPLAHDRLTDMGFTEEALMTQIEVSLAFFEHLRDGGQMWDDIRGNNPSAFVAKFLKAAKDETKTFDVFLDWDISDMPLDFNEIAPLSAVPENDEE
ncbi:hypothetical protein C8F01DRAFT_1076620 [Mycena amicta]|nr:hypothetical protein C8F01DRAFT_1076620 [Mycena amicta]